MCQGQYEPLRVVGSNECKSPEIHSKLSNEPVYFLQHVRMELLLKKNQRNWATEVFVNKPRVNK